MRSIVIAGARALALGSLICLLVSCDNRQEGASEDRRFNAAYRIPTGRDEVSLPTATDSASTLEAPESSEEYNPIRENRFLAAADHPLSTFSIDVDAASYSNVRRMLRQGYLPDADAVRVEEMINYFTYDYPQPSGGDPFSITTDVATCPWNPAHRLVQIGLQGKSIETEDLPPSNLVFLVDVSGSMNEPDKLPLVKTALQQVALQMREEDRVAIVVYAGAAGLVLPSVPGSQKRDILSAIGRLEAGGSTAGGEGINLAYSVAQANFIRGGNNRVILATDGDFNVGVSSEAGLVRLIEEKRSSGVFLTVLGFGSGNLKDSRMEQLADNGNGHYAYIDGYDEAAKVLVTELGATLHTIAKDVKIQVEFNPALVSEYRLVGYENRRLAARDFNDDAKDAGDLGAGHTVTALYEIVPASGAAQPGVDGLKYGRQRPGFWSSGSSDELLTVKLRYKEPDEDESEVLSEVVKDDTQEIAAASDNLKFAAAVAQWGMLLRDSEHRAAASFENVLRLARDARGADRNGYRAEFIELVEISRRYARTRM